MTFFHFTSPAHLPLILKAGALTTTDPNLDMFAVREPKVVWLLDTPTAAGPTAGHNGLYPAKTEIRFEVDVPAIRWRDWQPAVQMDPDWKETLIKVAGGEEVADHWYVFPAKIPARRWVSITDMLTGEQIPFRDAPST